ncbi:MAG: type I-E CRISPR-associated endoribonuclease Cas2e [Bradymonadaceae bacterium]
MSMTVAVTRNAPGRFHGFLASAMIEVAPGVYVAPRLKKSVRKRVWETLLEWDDFLPEDGGVALFWKSRSAPSGLGMRLLGWPKKELLEHEGTWVAKRALTEAHDTDELETLAEVDEPPPDAGDPEAEHLEMPTAVSPDEETESEGE